MMKWLPGFFKCICTGLLMSGMLLSCTLSNTNEEATLDPRVADVFQMAGSGSCQTFGTRSRALLTTRFKNLDHFKSIVSLTYEHEECATDSSSDCRSSVQISYDSNGEHIRRRLYSGYNQGDLTRIQKSDPLTQFKFVMSHPYAMRNRKALEMVYILSRRRADIYGSNDIAFYDLAEASFRHINTAALAYQSARDSLEKGYINTFNHITAQALISSFFSEELADLIGELHERYYMPELTTGRFSESQLQDTINNPVDNYVDLINNEIGQKIGNSLKVKYGLDEHTQCTPELLASILNDIQSYYMWALEIGMDPFRPTDVMLIKFSKKINALLKAQ